MSPLVRKGVPVGTLTNKTKWLQMARSFHSGKCYQVKKELVDVTKIEALLKAQTTQLKAMNSKLKAMEEAFTKKFESEKKKTIRSKVSKRITILGKSFRISEIAHVSYRPSFFQLNTHYIVQIDYRKYPATNRFLRLIAPVTSGIEKHQFKCKDEASAKKLMNTILKKCPHLIGP